MPDQLNFLLDTLDPLNVSMGPQSFVCPESSGQLVDFPDLVNHQVEEDFKAQKPGAWIFYQHLRKAGGTSFCDLANKNIPRKEIPPYYCMPDNKGSLSTPPWDNGVYTSKVMRTRGYRIAANEWDAFNHLMFSWPGVLFATTFRHPVDRRWFSQYRFEELERRDGSKVPKEQGEMSSNELALQCASCFNESSTFCLNTLNLRCMKKYYDNMKSWTMGSNYYVKTFNGKKDEKWHGNKGDFYWTYHKFRRLTITWEMFRESIDNLRNFNLVLILEWIDSSSALLKDALDWEIPPIIVLPHEMQALRYGKAGQKDSLSAKIFLSTDEYKYLVQDNILDILFFYVTKRIYLERLHKCKYHKI